MEELRVFKSIVDSTEDKYDSSKSMKELNVEISSYLSELNHLCSPINKIILDKIQNQLFLEKYINDQNCEPYYSIIGVIFNSFRQYDFPVFKYKEEWIKIVILLKKYITKYEYQRDFEFERTRYKNDKLSNLADAAKTLLSRGYNVEIREGDAFLDRKSAIDFSNYINANVELYGGLSILELLNQYFSNIFDTIFGRFIFTKHLSMHEYKDREIPYAYLINTCLKHLQTNNPIGPIAYKKLINDSKLIGAIYNVQEFNSFYNIVNSPELLVETLHDYVVYDNIFNVDQYFSDSIKEILFKWLDVENHIVKKILNACATNPLTIRDIKNGVNYLFSIFKNNLYFVIEINILLNVLKEREKVEAFLKLFSIESYNFNVNYNLPNEIDKSDLYRYPLIRTNREHCLMFHPCISGIGFYESILSEQRKIDNKCDTKFGYFFEDFLTNYCKKKKWKSIHGNLKNVEGECDLLLYSDHNIIVIEMKKKSLKRISKTGESVEIYFDFQKGILKALEQLTKQNVAIKRDGFIHFDDGTKIHINNRNVRYLTITLHEYASFNDNQTYEMICESMFQSKFHSNDRENDKDFDKFNLLLDRIRENIYTLNKDSELFRPFINYFCISYNQFFLLLKKYDNIDELANYLDRIRSITTGQRDFYFEMRYLDKMDKAHIDKFRKLNSRLHPC